MFCVRYYIGIGFERKENEMVDYDVFVFERKEKFMLIVITIYAVIVTALLIISFNA